jgi:hypothetical protein
MAHLSFDRAKLVQCILSYVFVGIHTECKVKHLCESFQIRIKINKN